MKIFVQWSELDPSEYERIESSNWNPAGRKIHSLDIQGVHFSGFDHIAVEDLPLLRGCRVLAWNDDPSDWPTGERHGAAWTFLPLGERDIDRAISTRQTRTLFGEDGAPGFDEKPHHPWREFPTPSRESTAHGEWLTDELNERHLSLQELHSWREYTDGVPEDRLDPETGLVASQRLLGYYVRSRFTITYFLYGTDGGSGSGDNADSDIGAGDFNFKAIDTDPGSGATHEVTVLVPKLTTNRLVFSWHTEPNNPGSDDWPDGDYRVQVDVQQVNSLDSYRFLTAQVDSGGSLDTPLVTQTGITGTGIKGPYTASADPSPSPSTHRYRFRVRATESGHQDQTFGINVRDQDSWLDGPWSAGSTPVEISASADALLMKEVEKSASADALLVKSVIASASADAVLVSVVTISASADALLKGSVVLSASADAMLAVLGTIISASADAILVVSFIASASADAILSKSFIVSASADALLIGEAIASATMDAVLAGGTIIEATADALLVKAVVVSALTDALLLAEALTSASADAMLSKAFAASATADALLVKAFASSASADALLIGEAIFSASMDAILTLGGVVEVIISASADARLVRPATLSASMDGLPQPWNVFRPVDDVGQQQWTGSTQPTNAEAVNELIGENSDNNSITLEASNGIGLVGKLVGFSIVNPTNQFGTIMRLRVRYRGQTLSSSIEAITQSRLTIVGGARFLGAQKTLSNFTKEDHEDIFEFKAETTFFEWGDLLTGTSRAFELIGSVLAPPTGDAKITINHADVSLDYEEGVFAVAASADALLKKLGVLTTASMDAILVRVIGTITGTGTRVRTITDTGTRSKSVAESGTRIRMIAGTGTRSKSVAESGTRVKTIEEKGARGS